MAFVSASDFKNGLTFELNGNLMQVVEFQHVKPGKGAAFVRTKIKNVVTGAVMERVFNTTEKFPLAYIEKKSMQYLYSDDENLKYFMDLNSYETIPIDSSLLDDSFMFVKEEMEVKVLFYKEKVFGVEPPNFVELTVLKTDPGFKGNTVTNATKIAILETGAEIKVPLFINKRDVVKIDTRIGEYIERVRIGNVLNELSE